tara:strand:+ start:577 stop:1620 length:1044 start_codon:yes stop_codon:yes gene_type:complete
MASISLRNLSKKFGKIYAVNDQNLEVKKGEFLVLLGPSGCGKTTTLNCIAGLEIPSSGEIFFDDVDVTFSPPHSRNIAMVFQSALLYPHLTCEQNILMSLHKTEITNSEKNSRLSEASEMLNISNLLNKKPHELSGGERQRVATAKAIVRQPDVFLLDEPMAALDAALRQTLRSELVNLQKKLNTTTIYVTHDQVEAMTMGDRIAVMNKGKVEQIDTPIEIYKNPKSKFVAGFIGSPPMNFIEGQIIEENNKNYFTSKLLRNKIDVNNLFNKKESNHLSFRPQHISITKDNDFDLELKVFGIENLGKEIIIICECGENKIRVIADDFSVQINDLVKMKIDRENILLF